MVHGCEVDEEVLSVDVKFLCLLQDLPQCEKLIRSTFAGYEALLSPFLNMGKTMLSFQSADKISVRHICYDLMNVLCNIFDFAESWRGSEIQGLVRIKWGVLVEIRDRS
uniref:Uncharacterized protein n=1 Tax=Megaselia scalaris TaxID=36166 RepID=T1GRV4_MEGSC